MPFVLDASVSACWAFDDEAHPTASLALERIRNDPARVPGLWWYEMRNILVVNERRQRIEPAETASFLRHVSRLGIRMEHGAEEAGVLTLARTYRLSVYDASYLELAQRLAIPLATLDTQLVRAAKAADVALIA